MYKSKKGWYYKGSGKAVGNGPYPTAEAAKSAARALFDGAELPIDKYFIQVYYGTPCRLSAAKDVYVKDKGHVYFTRIR